MQKDLFNNDLPAKPFLKWAGGKSQLIHEIESRLPNEIKDSKKIDKYFEPFLGGGAVYFHLMSNYKIKESFLYDINPELILTYNAIKNDVKKLIDELSIISEEFFSRDEEGRKDFYYNVRTEFNNNLESFDFDNYSEDHIKRAAQIIFMNRTCFNGLFRVNNKGEFNVPMGGYKNPNILNKDNLIIVSKTLKKSNIYSDTYLKSEDEIDSDSFVYLDPPYRPINKTSYFNKYSKSSFDDESQKELCEYYKRIDEKGAKIILNNSDPKNADINDTFFDDLYKDFIIERISARRLINSNAKNRGCVSELIIYNY